MIILTIYIYIYILCFRRGALSSAGIFRKSGGSSAIENLKQLFNQGHVPDLSLVIPLSVSLCLSLSLFYIYVYVSLSLSLYLYVCVCLSLISSSQHISTYSHDVIISHDHISNRSRTSTCYLGW